MEPVSKLNRAEGVILCGFQDLSIETTLYYLWLFFLPHTDIANGLVFVSPPPLDLILKKTSPDRCSSSCLCDYFCLCSKLACPTKFHLNFSRLFSQLVMAIQKSNPAFKHAFSLA